MKACLSTLAVAALLGTVPLGASAQTTVPPVTTGSSGYLFPNDQYQRKREEQRRQPSTSQRQSERQGQTSAPRERNARTAQAADAPIELDAAAQARARAAVQALVPEYHQRAKRDGEASANAWIKEQAFAIGQREGEIARRNQR